MLQKYTIRLIDYLYKHLQGSSGRCGTLFQKGSANKKTPIHIELGRIIIRGTTQLPTCVGTLKPCNAGWTDLATRSLFDLVCSKGKCFYTIHIGLSSMPDSL